MVWRPGGRGDVGRGASVARQILALQVLVVLVVVAIAVTLVYLDTRRRHLEEARGRAVATALTVADTPTVVSALREPDPSRTIQPFAERVRVDSGTDFVVVMALDRTRYSHPNPREIGRSFIGDLGGAPQGEVFTQQYTGTLGPSVRAVVPVYDGEAVVALVAVGITVERLDAALRARLLPITLASGLVLLVGLTGTWLISRRLRRQTHGLGEREMTRMYEYYDAVLHAVREGLLLLDVDGRVQLVNDEARRLLALPADVTGRPVTDLGLPQTLTATVLGGEAEPDEIHLVGDRVLVVNQAPATWEGRRVGSVVTFRDHTDLQTVAGELDTVRGFADALRAQNHEAANRLHTVVSLIEMGRHEEAVDFATEELQVAQLLTDRVVGAVDDPVVAALLLGKSAEAAERGVDLRISPDTEVRRTAVDPRDLVTVLGNLVDNAMDAVAESPERRVEVSVHEEDNGLGIRVEDSGAGLDREALDRIFERGWSTKPSTGPGGRGLGLALVVQVVRRYDGSVDVGTSDLGGARFAVLLRRPRVREAAVG